MRPVGRVESKYTCWFSTVKELRGDKATWPHAKAGSKAGSKFEDHLSQSAVVKEEPAEEQGAGITVEEVLVMDDTYQNVIFSGEVELEDGAEGEGVAPQGIPSAVQAVCPQVPSGKPAATDQEEEFVPLTNFDAKELNTGGRLLLSGPGKYECIPLVMRGAGAGPATAKGDPVSTPEATIEAFFRLLGHAALPDPAVDARILLKDEAIVAATLVAIFGDEGANLFSPGMRSKDGPGAVDEEQL